MDDSSSPGPDGSAPSGAGRKRREQQRAIETRKAILRAALAEFAERGFDGASMRRIGERAGLEFTLITYHYKQKDALWRAVAEYAFAQMEADWPTVRPHPGPLTDAEAVRAEFRSLLLFTVKHTAFHHFMLRENQGPSPRLTWLIDNILSKVMARVLPRIRAAQARGELIEGDPAHLYYMLVGMTSVLSSLSGEMSATIGFSLDDEAAVDRYWNLVERAIFK